MPNREEDEDTSLFRAAMVNVKRIADAHRIAPHRATALTRTSRRGSAEGDEATQEQHSCPEPEKIEAGDALTYRVAGVQDAVLRRLRRGNYKVQAELDLHGFTREQARHEVVKFIAHCHDRGFRCVRIIHGKGNSSADSGPVIKAFVNSWLRQRNDILAFCSARPADGGTGAVYVLLRAA